MRTPIVTRCSRCDEIQQCSSWDGISLCLSCVRNVVLEWAACHCSSDGCCSTQSGLEPATEAHLANVTLSRAATSGASRVSDE